MLEAGTKAPPFPRARGQTDKPLVLIFFKVGCPTCQFTMPFVQRIADAAESSATFLAVSQDDEAATREFYDTYGLRIPHVLDTKEERYPGSNAFRIEFVPTFFVISPDGMILQSFTGFVKSELESLGARFGIKDFLKGEKVPALKPG